MVSIVKSSDSLSREFLTVFMGLCHVGLSHVGFWHVGFCHVGFCQNWEIEVDVTYRTCCIFYIDPSGFTFLKITNFCKKFTLELIKILDPFKYTIGSDFVYFQSSHIFIRQSEIRGLRPQAFGPSFGFFASAGPRRPDLDRPVLSRSLETLIPHFNLGTFYYLWSFEVALE